MLWRLNDAIWYTQFSGWHLVIFQEIVMRLTSLSCIYRSVQFSSSVMSDSLHTHGLSTLGFLVFHQLLKLAQTHVYWVGDAIQPPHSLSAPFSSCLQSFPSSGYFPRSQFFASGGQSIGASPSTSVLPMNIQDQFPLQWTGGISLKFKGLSRVCSKSTVQTYQFFSAQLSI